MTAKSDISTKPFYSIGITDLVYLTKRSGDLKTDLSTYGRQRVMDGIRLHRKIQDSRAESYQSEVFLSRILEFDEFYLEIKGRADGMDDGAKPIIIEEIKSHTVDYKELEEGQKNMHLAQLYFYAFMLSEVHDGIDLIDLHLTYIHTDSEEIRTEKRIFKIEEIDFLCRKMIDKFRGFLLFRINHEKERNAILLAQGFPLPNFREGQRDLAAAVYRTVKRKEQLFIEAPTGTGKTIGILFPALKAMGEGIYNQLFFLTAKGTGKETAVKAMELMNNGNRVLSTVVITAKSTICFNPEKACDPEECAYCRGYFDKLDVAMATCNERYRIKGKEEIQQMASEYEICPFEFSLDLILSSDVVVCDYNYVYDPRVRLKRVFEEENKDVFLLADEAHNLVSRARDMYSSEIGEPEVAEGKKRWGKESGELKKGYTRVLAQFRILRKEFEAAGKEVMITPEGPEALCRSLRELMHAIERFNAKHPKYHRKKELMEDYFRYLAIVRIWEIYGKGHTTVIGRVGKRISVKLLCLDPSEYVSEITGLTGGAVFFSGTLTPIEFYIKSLFGERNVRFKTFPSPFPKEHVHVSAVTHISTMYRDRKSSLDELCRTIHTVISCKAGNYLVFCPSFAYLEDIVLRFLDLFPNIDADIHTQTPDMSQEDRSIFLSRLDGNREKPLLGFVVSGGVFGEGIDPVSDRLIGAVIVGVALPAINPETDALKDYYSEKYRQGFEFAYQYPGINTVLQNSGRVIRSETDKGIICFIDTRYARQDYRRFMPDRWTVDYVRNLCDLEKGLRAFWENSAFGS
jgi:DNA excision repair protein ERCC-2